MKQPTRKKKKVVKHITGTGKGIDFCDECPFLDFNNGAPYCSANDLTLEQDENNKVIIPTWCGNKRDEK